jgi:hypothetical protein
MSEIEINGQEYLCSRMPTRVQFHVARRLLPVIEGLRPLFANAQRTLVEDGSGNGTMVPDIGSLTIFDGLAALGNTLGMMSDADANYVLDNTLDAERWK